MKTFLTNLVLLLAILPCLAWASVRGYTESSPLLFNQTQAEMQDALLAKIRQDALNDTGVFIKKTATMDERQNLSESTTTIMARLIRIDSQSVHAVLTPNGANAPILSVTATVLIDDNELKNLASKEHELATQRLQNKTLRNQISELLKEKAAKNAGSLADAAIAEADSIKPAAHTSPNISLADLVADVPSPPAPKQSPSFEQSCVFFRNIWDDIKQDGVQNHLQAKLLRLYRPSFDPTIELADVEVSGSIDWDWSKEVALIKNYIGSGYFGDDHAFGVVDDFYYAHYRINTIGDFWRQVHIDFPSSIVSAYESIIPEIEIRVTQVNGDSLFEYDSAKDPWKSELVNTPLNVEGRDLAEIPPAFVIVYRHTVNIHSKFTMKVSDPELVDSPLVNVDVIFDHNATVYPGNPVCAH